MVVYFIRHGEVDNPAKIKYGRLPGFPLTEAGCREVASTGEQLKGKGIEAIFSSPLLRTRQTSEIVGGILHLPVSYDERLLEVDHGQYTGVKIDEFVRQQYWKSGAETLEQSGNRILGFLSEVKSSGKYQTIAVVGHEGPIIMSLLNREGRTVDDYDSVKLPTGGVLRVDY